MAFIVEDGTGLSTATSYLSAADFSAHHADRGVDLTTYLTTGLALQSITAVAAAGTGYVAGNILTLAGGSFTTAAQVEVLTVGGGGTVLTVLIVTAGSYAIAPSSPVAVTGGAGTGCTLTCVFESNQVRNALVKATDYVDKRFGRDFRGWRLSSGQALEWPRADAYDDDDYLMPAVPTQLKKAIAEYALLALQLGRNLAPLPGPGFPIVDPVTGAITQQPSGTIKSLSEVVGPIETSVTYEHAPGANNQLPAYPQADLWLKELLKASADRRVARG